MVSLIERSEYITELRKNSKFDLFFSLLFSVNHRNTFSFDAEVDRIFFNVLSSLIENGDKKFMENYTEISVREPKKNSPFTNDDLLLFLLICGAIKYNADMSWIKKIIDVRGNSDSEGKLITTTFRNIINNNHRSKDNAFQIIIALEDLLGLEYVSWEEKKQFYKDVTSSDFPFFKSDFLNILSIRAFDLVILQGDKSDDSLFNFLKDFEKRFVKRILLISILIYVLLCVMLIGLISWLVFSPSYEGLMGKFDTILGIVGIALFSFFKSNKVIYWISVILQRLLGHKVKINENSISNSKF
jgi:hypothetical protein